MGASPYREPGSVPRRVLRRPPRRRLKPTFSVAVVLAVAAFVHRLFFSRNGQTTRLILDGQPPLEPLGPPVPIARRPPLAYL
jgi:hypothetical protein